jgi:hypothetical protein
LGDGVLVTSDLRGAVAHSAAGIAEHVVGNGDVPPPPTEVALGVRGLRERGFLSHLSGAFAAMGYSLTREADRGGAVV